VSDVTRQTHHMIIMIMIMIISINAEIIIISNHVTSHHIPV